MRRLFILLAALSVFFAGCTSQEPIGGETDEHGCLIAAGYTWCEPKQKCLRLWEEPCDEALAEVTDFQSCAAKTGVVMESYPRQCAYGGQTYVEEACSSDGNILTLEDAMEIAKASECGDRLTGTHVCNENTGTYWLDLDIEQPGCSPACVVDLESRNAEINWRCTGLLPE